MSSHLMQQAEKKILKDTRKKFDSFMLQMRRIKEIDKSPQAQGVMSQMDNGLA